MHAHLSEIKISINEINCTLSTFVMCFVSQMICYVGYHIDVDLTAPQSATSANNIEHDGGLANYKAS